ncbi:MAG: pantetheine-phosphate adenylyltransferase [Nitrososphaerales archaeon]|nr:pantetheine-phosphate adenylyltransferase [Nitrososphaerales archaeon]
MSAQARKYLVVATGGTFDSLHDGHKALLSRSFEVGERVVIGVTSDSFARKEGKSPGQTYGERVERLKRYLDSSFPGRKYLIAKLDGFFGPGIASAEVEAIVVSRETASRVSLANRLRAAKGFPPLQVVTVEFVLAEDGKPISSTRIRDGMIDAAGRALKSR